MARLGTWRAGSRSSTARNSDGRAAPLRGAGEYDFRLPFPVTHSNSALTRARWATRLEFMALGVVVGTWGTHIPSVKARYELSEATLSLVLLAVAVGTVLALFIAGRIVGRLGARKTTALAALSMSLLFGARAGVSERDRATAGNADLRRLDEPV